MYAHYDWKSFNNHEQKKMLQLIPNAAQRYSIYQSQLHCLYKVILEMLSRPDPLCPFGVRPELCDQSYFSVHVESTMYWKRWAIMNRENEIAVRRCPMKARSDGICTLYYSIGTEWRMNKMRTQIFVLSLLNGLCAVHQNSTELNLSKENLPCSSVFSSNIVFRECWGSCVCVRVYHHMSAVDTFTSNYDIITCYITFAWRVTYNVRRGVVSEQNFL